MVNQLSIPHNYLQQLNFQLKPLCIFISEMWYIAIFIRVIPIFVTPNCKYLQCDIFCRF